MTKKRRRILKIKTSQGDALRKHAGGMTGRGGRLYHGCENGWD